MKAWLRCVWGWVQGLGHTPSPLGRPARCSIGTPAGAVPGEEPQRYGPSLPATVQALSGAPREARAGGRSCCTSRPKVRGRSLPRAGLPPRLRPAAAAPFLPCEAPAPHHLRGPAVGRRRRARGSRDGSPGGALRAGQRAGVCGKHLRKERGDSPRAPRRALPPSRPQRPSSRGGPRRCSSRS